MRIKVKLRQKASILSSCQSLQSSRIYDCIHVHVNLHRHDCCTLQFRRQLYDLQANVCIMANGEIKNEWMNLKMRWQYA